MGYWHSLYDTALHDKFAKDNCTYPGPGFNPGGPKCMAHFIEFSKLTQNVNVYDIFGICWGRGPYPQLEQTIKSKSPKKNYVTSEDYTPWLPKMSELTNELPPCTWGTPLIEYLNSDEVREALHIPSAIQAWDLCRSDDWYYTPEAEGSQWIYEALAGKYKMLHYSGDIDGAVPTIGTQQWIATLGWDTVDEWSSYSTDT
jgi:cathepsin A (carboxypeptidase C)